MNNDPHRQFPQAAFAGLTSGETSHQASDAQFDIFEWYPQYQSCQRYFLDHAQHSVPVQALASFLNIHLPMHRMPCPTYSYSNPGTPGQGPAGIGRGQAFRVHSPSSPSSTSPHADPRVSLIPYLRRLVATGMDFPGVLHGFFGDDWAAGVGPLHEQERRNYLFAAKSGGWASVKRDYDMLPLETVPFLRPLQGPGDAEIEAAERSWSEWLAMEDWMVGPRAPDVMENEPSQSRSRNSRQGP